jgi:hypothetical protein
VSVKIRHREYLSLIEFRRCLAKSDESKSLSSCITLPKKQKKSVTTNISVNLLR